MTFEVWLRLSAFLWVLLLCALFEWRMPRRSWRFPKRSRWLTNLTLTLLNTVLARLTLGAFAITAAIWAGDQDIGLFNQVAAPQWLILLTGVVVLDAAVWLQHRVTHRVPLLWRLHRVHHTDPELDVTTALRFHPVEIGLSLLWKALVVILLGLTPAAVILV
jgi:Sterol desaturase